MMSQGMTDTHASEHAVMSASELGKVVWTDGFWADWFKTLSEDGVKNMWKTWQTDYGKGWNNFLIASGEKEGVHHGPPFHDGDMYKWLEAVASVYAVNHDPELAEIMDRFIGCVVKSQRADGYIHTPVIIAERNKRKAMQAEADNTVIGTATGKADDGAFGNRLNFETYNLGHLITAGIIHKRATGKTTLYEAGIKAADFLIEFYNRASDELARNAICPSHYMAIAELYRETGDKKYLELAQHFIDIRGMVENGTDDNQDRVPFREQYQAMGHAVRSTYLYAGVADLYIEKGEEQLMKNLTSIWQDIVNRKMYITGGCGALYDGTSPDGTNYTPDSIQKVHQSFGRPYQLPHSTAHNETCANIGNMLFNWRMFVATGEAKYADVVETCFYNSILSGISLDGRRYFYTNPMRMTDELPYKLRWPKERKEYISCFCCPPNTLRTLCQTHNYAYSVGRGKVFVNLYGANTAQLKVENFGEVTLRQTTDYPWDGKVSIKIENIKRAKGVKKNAKMTFALRVPGWCSSDVKCTYKGKIISARPQDYLTIEDVWTVGDEIVLSMPMDAQIVEANPLVEESRGQVAVMRGPVVYCVESQDIEDLDIDNVIIPSNGAFTPVEMTIDGHRVVGLEGEVLVRNETSWTNTLYRKASTTSQKKKIRLIPYYAWGNRGHSEMSVWMPTQY